MAKTTSIILGEPFETFIQDKVASGQYASASEVIREAMRAFQREDEKERAVLSELDRALESPRATPGVFERLRKRRGSRAS
jgi:antitoxin ParD1/3/4